MVKFLKEPDVKKAKSRAILVQDAKTAFYRIKIAKLNELIELIEFRSHMTYNFVFPSQKCDFAKRSLIRYANKSHFLIFSQQKIVGCDF